MNAQKELEKILREKTYLGGTTISYHSDEFIKDLALTILAKLPELGFIRLEDMEVFLDVMRLKGLMNDICMECKQEKNVSCPYTCSILPNEVSKAIASAKGILRVKK